MNLNFIHAYRNLKKNSVYTFLTITGLSIGLTVFLLVSLFVYGQLTVDHCFVNHDRIIRLHDADKQDCGLDYDLAQIIKEKYPDVEAAVALERMQWETVLKSEANHIVVEAGIATTNEFFKVFDLEVIGKVDENPFSEMDAIILTESTAKKLFGSDNPLGKTINMHNMWDVRVTAVMQDFPDNASLKADFLINAENEDLRFSYSCANGDCYFPMHQMLLLNEGVNATSFVQTLNADGNDFQQRIATFGFRYLDQIYLEKVIDRNTFIQGNALFLKVISFIACLILLLAVINFINFSLSLQQSKIREISIKKINGAGKWQLLFYYLTETWQILMAVVVLSVFLVFALSGYGETFFGTTINPYHIFTGVILSILTAVVLIIILFNSVIPIYTTWKLNVVEGIANKGIKGNKRSIKPVLITLQFTISIMLLVGVFSVLKQLKYIEQFDLGFKKEQLLNIHIPYEFNQTMALQQSLNNLNFVSSSTYSTGAPGQINLMMGSGDTDHEFMVDCIKADKNFIATMAIDIALGRDFHESEAGKACIMNEAAYKKYEWNSIENKRYNNGSQGGYEVVGIVNDFNVSSIHNKLGPVCILFDVAEPNSLTLRLTKGNTKQQMDQIETVWAELVPNEPFSFEFYDSFFNQFYKKEQQLAQSVSLLAIIAFLLTIIGIVGQVMQTIIQKTKEIGIRKVNGANALEVLQLLNGDFIKWVLLAFVLACPVAYFVMSRWLQNFAYKTTLNWWLFALAGCLAMAIALIAVSWQTLRAARKNPVEALRYE